ncbi:hypothetical protein C2E23DRAFT_479805 [Lenzites betulinus]|nr:hypothetical protein C2E23DRAFT_479805 [Lenzites betulinus]
MSEQPVTSMDAPTLPSLSLSSLPPIGPNYGALLVGTFLSLILYGVEMHQVYTYFSTYYRDGPLVKCYVAMLVGIDTVNTVFAMHFNHWFLVENYFHPLNLTKPLWSFVIQPLTTAILIFISQLYFARRVCVGIPVDQRYATPLMVGLGVMFLVELGFGIAFTWKGFQVSALGTHVLKDLSWMQTAGFGTAVLVDVLCTSVLVTSLHRHRTGFRKTDSMIDILIAYAVSTGLLTTVVTIICIILNRIAPGKLLFGAADLILVKVYVNSVLAALNTRQSMWPGPQSNRDLPAESIGLPSIAPHRANADVRKPWKVPSTESTASEDGSTRPATIDIKVNREIAAVEHV